MREGIYKALRQFVEPEQILEQEPLKKYVTFRIGGPADYLVLPRTAEEIAGVIEFCRTEQIPWYLMGNGSNLLVSDEGFRGVVIRLSRNFGQICVDGARIRAQAGALNSAVAKRALEAALTGYEFAAGIPGTVGGAAVMNAGAYGGEMKDILEQVTVLDEQGQLQILMNRELEMGYRTSILSRKGYTVLETVFRLQPGDTARIQEKMEQLRGQRMAKQPLDVPSAGSTFKRPEGYFAGKLIMDAGLRGYAVGDAQVSEKHCGFVINRGQATAREVAELMAYVQKTVQERFGVFLEPEVRRLGNFN